MWMEDSACNKLAELALNDVQACLHPVQDVTLRCQTQLCTSSFPDWDRHACSGCGRCAEGGCLQQPMCN